MTPGDPATSGPLPRWRWRYVGDVALLVTCLISTTFTIVFATTSLPEDSPWVWVYMLVFWPLALVLDGAVLLRRGRPLLASLIACTSALLLPIDALAALIVLPWVIARCRPRAAWGAAVLTALATLATLTRDWDRGSEAMLTLGKTASGDPLPFPVLGFVTIGVLALGVAVVTGVVRRLRLAQREQQRAVENLRSELSSETIRQDERDLIARELHDSVAHHLSLVALRASALEVTSSHEAKETARSVRATAHDALEEMRDLIGGLRQGHLTPGPAPGRTLVDLPTLIDSVRAGGTGIDAIVYVSGPDTAPRALAQVVYRIVQESLTNAIKHAPGARIDLDLRAAPGFGVRLRVRNPVPDSGPPGGPGESGAGTLPGSGTGLVGMRERAASVGGVVEHGPVSEDGAPRCWQVAAHLPWPVDEPG